MTKIYINKTDPKDNILIINNEEWQKAIKSMNLSAFALFLYLASQKDKVFILSRQDFEDKTGFQKSSYYEAISKLKQLGYLKEQCRDVFAFSTVPFPANGTRSLYFCEILQ